MNISMNENYMAQALLQAEACLAHGDVPVGCVIVKDCKIIAVGRNERELGYDATAHGEIIAIRNACRAVGSWRLDGCDMYVTLEPCPMCAGAIINSRLSRVFFGAYDKKGGACGGVLNLFYENFNHKPQVYGGILEKECAKVLEDFFLKKRM